MTVTLSLTLQPQECAPGNSMVVRPDGVSVPRGATTAYVAVDWWADGRQGAVQRSSVFVARNGPCDDAKPLVFRDVNTTLELGTL